MKFSARGSVIAVALTVIVLLIYLVSSHPGSVTSYGETASVQLSPQPNSSPSSSLLQPLPAEDVPLYVGARNIKVGKVYPKQWRDTSYSTSASIEEVEAFYKAQLLKDGWNLEWENSNVPQTKILSYSWLDGQEASPYDLSLGVQVTEGTPTLVELSLYRVPNLSRIPLYPTANQIEGANNNPSVPTARKAPTTKRAITYTTPATLAQVLAYYRNILPQCGWLPDDGDANNTSSALFNWSTGGVDSGMWVASVKVDVQLNTQKLTQVKLEIRGETNLR